MQDTPPNTAIATQIKSEIPALYLLAELESFRVMLLCLVLLLQASRLLKLVDSPFRRCGWVCGSRDPGKNLCSSLLYDNNVIPLG
jgi:hypothetical protein